MNLRIRTANPEFYSDLSDVLRLFYGDVTVADCSGQAVEAGSDLFEHTFETVDGTWIDTWTNEGRSHTVRTPACEAHPIEIKRLRKRAVKLGLYNLLKEITGLPPQQYLLHSRLNRAAELLKTTRLSVKEIAAQTGWDNVFYFSRLFRQKYSISPVRYRREFHS